MRLAGDRKPLHEHDCDSCTFLGTWDHYDLYHCSASDAVPTVIARWGPAENYVSGLPIARAIDLAHGGKHGIPGPDLRALRIAFVIARDADLAT